MKEHKLGLTRSVGGNFPRAFQALVRKNQSIITETKGEEKKNKAYTGKGKEDEEKYEE